MIYHRCLKHHAYQQYQKLSTSNCIYAYSGTEYATNPQTKVRFFQLQLSLLLYYYYRVTLFSYVTFLYCVL